MSKKTLIWIAIIWLVSLTAGIASAVTIHVAGSAGSEEVPEAVLVTQQQYEMIQKYEELERVYQILMQDYYKDVDGEVLMQGAIDGMMASLEDRYTFFYTKDEMEAMYSESSGEYKGIGVALTGQEDGAINIVSVYRDTPAYRAGVKVGDVLVKVNGQAVTGATEEDLDNVIYMIRDFGDDEFELTFTRGGEEYTVSMVREECVINRVEYELLDDNIGYIQIVQFMGDDVKGFKEALEYFRKCDLQGLIVDVRNNTGGYLDHVVEIADLLLPEGLIVYTEDRAGNRLEERSKASCVSCPIVCLINGGSASASEVLSGALQDYEVGAIIGSTSFGKGIVQTVMSFDNSTGLQLTTAVYYTPAGRCIHGIGITPDYEVIDDEETEEDEVLDFAKEWFRQNNAAE